MFLRNLALASSLALAAAPTAAYAAPTVAAETSRIKAPIASAEAAKNYAEREQQDNHKTAEFQGGDIVVIGVSGGALVVLLFLLLILV